MQKIKTYFRLFGEYFEQVKIDIKKQEEPVTKLIAEIVSADKIFAFGLGRSGLVAKAFAMRLMHLGLSVYVVGETICPAPQKDDLLVVFSGSGGKPLIPDDIPTTLAYAKLAKTKGTKVGCITQNNDSELAKISDVAIVLNTKPDEQEKELALMGTLFETMAGVLADAIIAELKHQLSKTESDMKKNHNIFE